MPWSEQHSGMELPPSPNLSAPTVQRSWILVQCPAENGPASGCLWFLERSWMSQQPAAASCGQASPGVGSIPPPAPGAPPANVLPGKRCKSSAVRSYPCLPNGLKTSESIESIFYFNDQKGVAHYSQPQDVMIFNFPVPIIQSIWQLTFKWSWFFKNKNKKKKREKKSQPISAYQKSKIILNETAMSPHAKAVSRAASARSSQLLPWQREKFGFRRASAGCLERWTLPCQQLQHQKWHF